MMDKLDGLEKKLSNAAYDLIDFYDLNALRQAIYILSINSLRKG